MTLAEFHFIRPYCLLALLPLILLLFTAIRRQQSSGLWSEVCDAALLPFLLDKKVQAHSRAPMVVTAIAAVISIIALAGPTWERLPSPVFSNQSALVIALDLSLTMNAGDVAPSRLVRARYKIADLLKRRKDGQSALLVYAGDAFTVTPLTNDTDTIDSQLSALSSDIMPSQGNNTGKALEKAAALLKQAGLNKGQILLVTDAIDPETTPDALKQIGNYNVSVLAVGTAEGAPIKATEGDFVKDAQGSILIPKLNATELANTAKTGHGLYMPLSDSNQDIEQLTQFLEQSLVDENAKTSEVLLQQWAEKGPWLVVGVLPLAALCFRKGLLSLLLLVFIPLPKNSYALEWQDLWQTKDQQAQQAFAQKDYAKAAEGFKNPEWQAAAQYKAGHYDKALESLKGLQSADSFYNQGNALAQAGKLEEAIKAYDAALKLNPNDADAKYNKDLVEKELKKQQEQQKDKNKDQNKDKQDNNEQNKDQQGQNKDQHQDQQGKDGDKSDPNKSAQDQSKSDQQKADQQAKDDQQQKPEDKENNKDAQQQSAADKAKEQAQKEAEAAKAKQQAEAKKDEQKPDAQGVSAKEAEQKDEAKQANEQWLKRIPDDPAGLLKRKFKYQYGQQNRAAPDDANPF